MTVTFPTAPLPTAGWRYDGVFVHVQSVTAAAELVIGYR